TRRLRSRARSRSPVPRRETSETRLPRGASRRAHRTRGTSLPQDRAANAPRRASPRSCHALLQLASPSTSSSFVRHESKIRAELSWSLYGRPGIAARDGRSSSSSCVEAERPGAEMEEEKRGSEHG